MHIGDRRTLTNSLYECDVSGSCRAKWSSWSSSSKTTREHWASLVVQDVIKNCLCSTAQMHVVPDVSVSYATTPTVDVLSPAFLCPRLATLHGSAFSAIRKCKYHVILFFCEDCRIDYCSFCGNCIQQRSTILFYDNLGKCGDILGTYTLSLKKVSHLMFDNNFGKYGPIFKFFSPIDTKENSLCMYHKNIHLTCSMLLHYLAKF